MGDLPFELPVERFVGEITPYSTLTLIYETYSDAWEIPLVMAKEFMDKGWAVVITNYLRPLNHFLRDLEIVGIDAEKALDEDTLFIIDVFGSRYHLRTERRNVFYLDPVEPETLNPKIFRIYQENIIPRTEGKRILRIVYPLHGVVQIAGEEPTVKMLSQVLSLYSRLPVESFLVMSLNRDTVSKNFTAWIVELSDYVLLSKAFVGKGKFEEHLYFLKAPIPGFKPEEYLLIKTGKTGRERFGVKRLGELIP